MNPTLIIGDRDFLMGSVWEGTGEEIHVNRPMADKSEFGGRILSGIGGMLLAVGAYDRGLLIRQPSTLIWSFNGYLLEHDHMTVAGERADDEFAIAGRVERDVGGRPTTEGKLEYEQPILDLTPVKGTRTRGQTFTSADVDLYWTWLGTEDEPPRDTVPWPMVVLLASGLVSRSNYLGEHDLTLNRGFTWTFREAPPIGETLFCVISPIRERRSVSRPDLKVGRYSVAVTSYTSSTVFATVEWTVLFR